MKHIDDKLYKSYLIVGDGWTMTSSNFKTAIRITEDGKGRINLYGIKEDGTKDRID